QDNKKLPAFMALLARRGVAWEECAFAGDDIPDLPLLRRVALPIAVANAVTEVKAAASLVTQRAGGDAAVREIAETLLQARGVWDELIHRYLLERGDVQASYAG
ncbi:MAG: HAD hydrolase family protein, partial [Gemmatimonadales bacterium]